MGLLRSALTQAKAVLVSCFALEATEDNAKLEDLARSILEYVRMRRCVSPEEGLIVDPGELAFRYREAEWTIEGALRLLESRGQATEFEEFWELQV